MNADIGITATPAPGKPGRFLVVARSGEGELHRDTLDLNSATSRKRFVGATLQAAFSGKPPDDWPDGVRPALEKQLSALAAAPPGNPEPPPAAPSDDDPRAAALAEMPPEVRAEAAELLSDPNLAQRVVEDLTTAGVVGESSLKLTAYLCGVSTQLSRPLAIIVRGSSSSGKSYVVNTVADLFPPEVVLRATDITSNALYYFPPGTLRHRWVVAGERSRVQNDESAETTRALREMIETRRLSKAVTVKTAEGGYTTRSVEQDGPIAFSETTTLGQIFDEDRNRCLVLSTDERPEQTKRILAATARRAEGRDQSDLDRIREVHHAVIRMLPRADVVIPFASVLSALFADGPARPEDARRLGVV
jgi:hypothetical protein